MEHVKKKLGFGCMRLPMTVDEKVDTEEFSKKVDVFPENSSRSAESSGSRI